MKIEIDHESCVGHARCYILHPDYIGEDERGKGVVKNEALDLPPEVARELVRACPEAAIRIRKDSV